MYLCLEYIWYIVIKIRFILYILFIEVNLFIYIRLFFRFVNIIEIIYGSLKRIKFKLR